MGAADGTGSHRGGRSPQPPQILICLLGTFRVLRDGDVVPFRRGGKMESLLCALALGEHQHASRDALLDALWPRCTDGRARQSLNTLVHDVRRVLAGTGAGRPPVVRTDDGYGLNPAAGVVVDTVWFDTLAAAAADRLAAGDTASAVASYENAVAMYRGDLRHGDSLRVLMERERLRALYLTALAHLADHYLGTGAYAAALHHAQRLLQSDPCREDAHRVVMRCFARLGQRAQAMQQYRLCRQVLLREFDAAPEQATEELFARLRLKPDSV